MPSSTRHDSRSRSRSRSGSRAIRSQLQYRTSFLLQAFGQFALTGIEFLGMWALFHRFGSLRGWSFPEVAMFYGLVSVTFAIADALARGMELCGVLIKTGEFDRILMRPRHTILQLIGQELTLRRAGRLLQGLLVLSWAMASLDIAWDPRALVSLSTAIAGGVCLFVGLAILQTTMTFWTTEPVEFWDAFTYGGATASQYPIVIYRSWLRRFFTYVIPLACVSYFPLITMLRKTDPLGTSVLFQSLAPLAGVVFLAISLLVWEYGVRHYRSCGN